MAELTGTCWCGAVRFAVAAQAHTYVRPLALWETLPDDRAERYEVRAT